MKVRQLMESPALTARVDATVGEVARILAENHVTDLAVVDDSGSLLGLVTQSDLLYKHAQIHLPRYLGLLGAVVPVGSRHFDDDIRKALAVTAGDLMHSDVQVVSPDDPIDSAATVMAEAHGATVAVNQNGRLIGLLRTEHIVRLLVTEEQDSSSAG